ncbi:MAG: hypothetical protein MI723_09755, partial [Caulobacterales bacterium]|nr:hypothetical protein [Caulobacterales bacterium]
MNGRSLQFNTYAMRDKLAKIPQIGARELVETSMPYWMNFRVRSLYFIMLFFIASCAERTSTLSPSADSSPCSLAIQQRLELNAFELLEATNTCASENKKFEANLL